MEKWEWLVDTFTFIGMAVCIIIAAIAIVWLTCFLVKLLVKTFGIRVGKSYDLMVEDIEKKSAAKKERNEIKRQAKFAQKKELLNMKLENKAKIHEMKKAKLEGKLDKKEAAVKVRLFGDENFELKTEPKTEKKTTKPSKQEEPKPVEDEKVDDLVEVAETEPEVVEEVSEVLVENENSTKKSNKKK